MLKRKIYLVARGKESAVKEESIQNVGIGIRRLKIMILKAKLNCSLYEYPTDTYQTLEVVK